MGLLAGQSATMNKITTICANILGNKPHNVGPSARGNFRAQLTYEGLREAFQAGKNNAGYLQPENSLSYYLEKKLLKAKLGSTAERKTMAVTMAGAIYAKIPVFTDDQGTVFNDAWDAVSDQIAGVVGRTIDRIYDAIKAEASCFGEKIEVSKLVSAVGVDIATANIAGTATTVYLMAVLGACNAGPEASARVQCKIKAIFDGRQCDAPKAAAAKSGPASTATPAATPAGQAAPNSKADPEAYAAWLASRSSSSTPTTPAGPGALTAGMSTPALVAGGAAVVLVTGLLLRNGMR